MLDPTVGVVSALLLSVTYSVRRCNIGCSVAAQAPHVVTKTPMWGHDPVTQLLPATY